jgi:hypothetical protein
MNEAFSEYVLYEPILRILTARRWVVQCEYPCPGFESRTVGDKKRIDFVATAPWSGERFALEMKWARQARVNVSGDIDKLVRFRNASRDVSGRALLCIFGRKSFLEILSLNSSGLSERGRAIYAELGRTRYGCRIYEVTDAR